MLLILNYRELKERVMRRGGEVFIWLYGGWALLSTVWSQWQAITFQRSCYLLLLLMGLYAASINKGTKKGEHFFMGLFVLNALAAAMQYWSLAAGIPGNRWSGGNGLGFMGVFPHQNTAAMILLFTLPGSLFYLTDLYYQKTGGLKLQYIKAIMGLIVFLGSIVLIFLSSSRSVILSLFVLLISYGILSIGYRKILKWSGAGLMLGAIMYLLIPSLPKEITFIIYKNSASATETRLPMYIESYKAAKNGGITGLGFGVSDPSLQPLIGHYEGGHFIREKGNSALAMIEELGLVGIAFYLIFYFRSYINLLKRFTEKNKRREEKETMKLSVAFLLAALVHAQFEGWWVGITSFAFITLMYLLFLTNNSGIKGTGLGADSRE